MEILFRGKRIDTGEWVYGDFYRKCGITGIVHDHRISTRDGMAYPVIPETVGWCTGLIDKNGKDIFDGDVLHWDSHRGWYVGYENGAFRRIPLSDIQRWNWRHHPLEQEGLKTWGVIGNIHDNPELVEGKE